MTNGFECLADRSLEGALVVIWVKSLRKNIIRSLSNRVFHEVIIRLTLLGHSEFFAKNRISTVFHCISTVFQYFRRTFNLKS